MLFEEQLARKPNLYPWAQDFIEAIWQSFWTPSEFNFLGDLNQFHSEMTDQERQIVSRTLSAIGQVEIAVKKFWTRLGDNLPHPAMSDLGVCLGNSEVIHNQAYEKLLTVLGLEDIFEANLQEPVFRGRVEYLRKHLAKVYDDDRRQYVYSIILFTLFVENVSLFSQFYTILWFSRSRNLLKDTAQQVQYTRNEEALHAQVGMKIINTLRVEYPELFDAELETMIQHQCDSAIHAEGQLIDWMVGDYQDSGLSADILRSYIRQRMNQSLEAIGFAAPYHINPDHADRTLWMEEASLGDSRTDFFFKRPVEYARSNKTYNPEDLFA